MPSLQILFDANMKFHYWKMTACDSNSCPFPLHEHANFLILRPLVVTNLTPDDPQEPPAGCILQTPKLGIVRSPLRPIRFELFKNGNIKLPIRIGIRGMRGNSNTQRQVEVKSKFKCFHFSLLVLPWAISSLHASQEETSDFFLVVFSDLTKDGTARGFPR